MLRTFAFIAAVTLTVGAQTAAAQPIKLKAALFSSDRSSNYHAAMKPFVEAVNAEAKGAVEIEIYSSGELGKDLTQQPRLVLDGIADLAFIIPGYLPELFTDNAVIELPGLFRDMREATFTYTHLIAAGALAGYEDFFTVAAFATDPQTLHTRPPVGALAELRGLRIRVNNAMAAAALARFGVTPFVMPINQAAEAISAGKLDGTMAQIPALFEFGIGRMVTHHYMLRTSVAPLALVMNRKKFDRLPPQIQEIVRKYSGEWAARRYVESLETASLRMTEQLRSDPDRRVVIPSLADQIKADDVFTGLQREWVANSPRHAALLRDVKTEIAKLRQSE